MISLILFIMIGIKLNMLNGWYLALLIIYAVFWGISLFANFLKKIIEEVGECNE